MGIPWHSICPLGGPKDLRKKRYCTFRASDWQLRSEYFESFSEMVIVYCVSKNSFVWGLFCVACMISLMGSGQT